jgi:hypothetical protein
MIDRATLERLRSEYDAERINAEQTLLRIQGAIIAVDELLVLEAKLQPDPADPDAVQEADAASDSPL